MDDDEIREEINLAVSEMREQMSEDVEALSSGINDLRQMLAALTESLTENTPVKRNSQGGGRVPVTPGKGETKPDIPRRDNYPQTENPKPTTPEQQDNSGRGRSQTSGGDGFSPSSNPYTLTNLQHLESVQRQLNAEKAAIINDLDANLAIIDTKRGA
jgi:hypothetical protein